MPRNENHCHTHQEPDHEHDWRCVAVAFIRLPFYVAFWLYFQLVHGGLIFALIALGFVYGWHVASLAGDKVTAGAFLITSTLWAMMGMLQRLYDKIASMRATMMPIPDHLGDKLRQHVSDADVRNAGEAGRGA